MLTLNPPQCEAVQWKNGPLLILAGAGSGKTRVITHRIAYLIQQHHVSPYHILAVTFTNKAAEEMKSRISKLISHDLRSMWIGTFHSICARLLRIHAPVLGYEIPFSIFDDQDSQSLLKKCFKELNINDDDLNPQAVLSHINRAKNCGLFPADYVKKADTYFEKVVSKIYTLYQQELKKNQAMDFGDLLLQTVYLFHHYPNILSEYQSHFQYVMIDEYQDTNRIQYLFASAIACLHHNIF